jgi:hypothetical protein
VSFFKLTSLRAIQAYELSQISLAKKDFEGSCIAVARRISLAGQDSVVHVLLSLAGFHWLGKILWFSFCYRPPDFIGWEGFGGSRIADLVQRLLKWIWRGSPFC